MYADNFIMTRLSLKVSSLKVFRYSFSEAIPIFFNRLKSGFFLVWDRCKIFTSNWLWIEICENVVLSKIDITMTTVNKKFDIDKSQILCYLDQLLKFNARNLKFGV